jgi:hypothetical protein
LFSLTPLCVTWWLVLNVRRRPRRATRSGYDVAGQGFHMYLPKAKACLATRFCSTYVAADCLPREKQAAAGQLAGARKMCKCRFQKQLGSQNFFKKFQKISKKFKKFHKFPKNFRKSIYLDQVLTCFQIKS